MADEKKETVGSALSEEKTAALKETEWQKTLRRLGLGEMDVTNVNASDILYIAERWQFLQVVEIANAPRYTKYHSHSHWSHPFHPAPNGVTFFAIRFLL